jgi:DNA-binding transcriptional LysR family regulator
MMDWEKLRVFHAVAEAGSFTRAGDELGLSQSAVSRKISALEDTAAAPLFHRHARGLILTEQGELLYRTVREVFAKLAMVEGQLAENKDHPKGQLKVTSTVGLGSFWLAPRIGEFIDLYPDVSVDLVLDDKELDLSMREADVAIRLIPPRQAELVQRHLMTIRNFIYASRTYIERYGVPRSIADLSNHKIVVYGDETRPPVPELNWLLTLGVPEDQPRRPVLTVNNVYSILRAVQSGLGIAQFAKFMGEEQHGLVQILPEVEGPRMEAYFVYPEELRNSKRIQVFRDFLLRKVAEADL